MKKNTKNLGQYFTPEHVADFMIGLSSVSLDAKILEPACGEGIFLKLLEEKGYKNIVGYEIDKTLPVISKAPIVYKSFVQADIRDTFDLIIGNPPYIRWKNLDPSLKQELEQNHLWQKNFNSLCDYLFIFIVKSVELLKENGQLIFITPEYWMNTKHAEGLRNYLVKNGIMTRIIHFRETPLFQGVTSSFIIFTFVKTINIEKKKKKIKVTKYLSKKKLKLEDLFDIKNDVVKNDIEIFERDQFEVNELWMLAPDSIATQLKKYEKKCFPVVKNSSLSSQQKYISLGDIADIGNGMVSGLDKAFQIPNSFVLSPKEKKATLSVVKAKNLKRFSYTDVTKYIFLNCIVQTEDTLKKEYPNFYQLLQSYKEKLALRYSYKRKIPYWEWVFLRNYKMFQTENARIFVPCKERISHKKYFRFAYVPSGIFPTQDVTAIFLKPAVKESIYFILALLNSEYVFEWLQYKGVVKGSIVEFSEKPLASIPMRMIDWNNPSEVAMYDEIVLLSKEYIDNNADDEALLSSINKKVMELF